MIIARVDRISHDPTVLVAGCFYCKCKYLLVLAFVEPAAVGICGAALLFFQFAASVAAVVIAVFQRLFAVLGSVGRDLFLKLLL